jgi:invasion protein IalB
MLHLQRCFGLSVGMLTPLVAVCWAGIAVGASGGEHAATASRSGPQVAQQAKPEAKPAPSAPAKTAPAAGAPAQPAAEVSAWAVNCTDQGQPRFTCEMTQALVDQKTNAQIMLLSIKSVAGGDAKALLVRLFHGIYLPAGVSIQIDGGTPTPIAFQKSDQFGVYAALPLTDRIVADMKRGKDLKFSLQINQNEPLEVVARLNGFGPAFDRIGSVK